WVIITENKEKWLPIVYLLSLFINVVLNIIYVPKFGYTASALITVLSELIVLVLLFGIMKTRKKKVAVKVKKVKKKKTS
ncbi:MAG TPA: polysaccharide biosynthesis C-terminal domain-containing protein, partial [Candidatus Nitrosocosmicus sp.]|nr:polysaccharide biosynthesis C-terminal domain-containing protein [Candidatus Nitrosocosmicus sp.]